MGIHRPHATLNQQHPGTAVTHDSDIGWDTFVDNVKLGTFDF